MDYQNTLKYLYESAPMFQQIGSSAYKEGLETTIRLDEHFGYPHQNYRTIHVGGTNGKGSCSHTLAAVLQSAGYRVGLYTSPHLVDFRERIRINGEMIPEEYVVDFVETHKAFFEPLYPSFFELTTAMAFRYFADQKVDVAVIEVGLGGRLDCTNIISPDLCVITNISFDHMQFLGNTLAQIALEKAGIIKNKIPVIIGETTPETRPVFEEKANNTHAPILFAQEHTRICSQDEKSGGGWIYHTEEYPRLEGELGGLYQIKNTNTILHAIDQLKKSGYLIDEKDIRNGFAHVCELTGLTGRWQKLNHSPLLICDTGHNVGGITDIVQQISSMSFNRLHIVIGMVNDKDINGILDLLPRNAVYYFTKASVKRALTENELMQQAIRHGLSGQAYSTVTDAVREALAKSLPEDFIFVGGSSFIVADLLADSDALDLH